MESQLANQMPSLDVQQRLLALNLSKCTPAVADKKESVTSSNNSSNYFRNELPLVQNPPPQPMPQTWNDLGAFENGKKIRYFLRELKSIGRQVGATLNCDAEVDYSRLTAVKPNKKLLNVECASTKNLQQISDTAVDSSFTGDISQVTNLVRLSANRSSSTIPDSPSSDTLSPGNAGSDVNIRSSMYDLTSRKKIKNNCPSVIDVIGSFLTDIFRRKVLSPLSDWTIPKTILRERFHQFLQLTENANWTAKLLEENAEIDVDILLRRSNFLINPRLEDAYYRIEPIKLLNFYREQIEECDKKNQEGLLIEPSAEDEEVLSNELVYKNDYEVEYQERKPPILTLKYYVCENRDDFRITMKSAEKNIVIKKISITKGFLLQEVPYIINEIGNYKFYVRSSISTENASIVIVFHKSNSSQQQIAERFIFPQTKRTVSAFKQTTNLSDFWPPTEVQNQLTGDNLEDELCKTSVNFQNYFSNGKTVTQQNMCNILLKLLQIEDRDSIRKYDCKKSMLRSVQLRRDGDEYSFKLKGLQLSSIENLIAQYDEVFILWNKTMIINSIIDENLKNNSYHGQVDRLENGHVTFTSNADIPTNEMHTIVFRPSRMQLRYQYQALQQLNGLAPSLLSRFLFPDQVPVKEIPPCELDLLNKNIYDNPEQYRAIRHIAAKDTKQAAPYIVFGPPGTGKTTTIVEAIWQVYNLQPQSKILIMAGSNGACDEIALRLCKILLLPLHRTETILRVYARSQMKRKRNINKLLLKCSNMNFTEHYPNIQILHEYRIIVCTLSVVGYLSTGNFGSGVFTHIFIDEVAASTECETLVGLANTISDKVNLIISGDHKQLGPILNSDRAAKLGLNKSLMERLLQRDCYRVDEFGNYNTSIQSRLCRNYRSHPAIVELYSKLYYNDELKASASPDVQKLCKDWHRSPNNEYPIIFHYIFGKQQREGKSTSWYNYEELSAVMDYVKDLMYFGVNGEKIKQTDIGIISPYKSQYTHIRKQLNKLNWNQIETGAVETFQGKEKRIIIASFVRSHSKGLGFLECPRRLNVLLSRAKCLLILIGNPDTLSMNSDLKQVIDKCIEKKTVICKNYYELNKSNNGDTDQLIKSMEKWNLSKNKTQ